MKYDESVIQEQAQRLYAKSRSIALSTALIFAIAAGVVGMFFEIALSKEPLYLFPAVAAFVGFILGHSNGSRKGFTLRLEAQLALCQVQIEKNTRNSALNESQETK